MTLHHSSSSNYGTKKYVLGYIGDHSGILNSTKQWLDNEKFTIFIVNNPVKALLTTIQKQPDLVFLDLAILGSNGYDLCSLLKKHPKFTQTPIIIIASDTSFTDRVKANQANASAYLNQPLTQEQLLQTIGHYLEMPI
ncbi:MAG: response regulator [Cyanothece sp. SIO2G6]|nr:response regulator [Cyanothece sp. SIO2G6]